MKNVESFELDHRNVVAPYVRKCGVLKGEKGDIVTKFDLRFTQPNKEAIPTASLHALEHLLAGILREHIDNIIDISPMGCRTGFYLIIVGDYSSKDILPLIIETFEFVRNFKGDIPGATAQGCGNYLDMNLNMAKYYANRYLNETLYKATKSNLEYPGF